MKKIISIIIISCIFFVGCSKKETTTENPKSQEQDVISNETSTNDSSSIELEQENELDEESGTDSQENEDESAPQDEGFIIYRPEVGDERVFLEDGIEVQKEEVIAENDEYVQILVTSGANKFLEIYRWTKDEISLLYQELNPNNERENRLANFDPGSVYEDNSEIFISKNKETNWEIVEEDMELEIEGQTYSNVLAIKKVSEEVVGETTTQIKYFAPGKGMIKDFIETTGEYGFTSEMTLSN